MKELDLIMEPPIFVEEMLVDARTNMLYGETKDIRNWAKKTFKRLSIEKQASEIRKALYQHSNGKDF